MPDNHLTRAEIEALAARLQARAESRLMHGTPELASDLRAAAAVIRRYLGGIALDLRAPPR
jgi:hypothetical protein